MQGSPYSSFDNVYQYGLDFYHEKSLQRIDLNDTGEPIAYHGCFLIYK